MMLNPNEAGAFWKFLSFVHKHTKGDYRLKLENGNILECKYFTSAESDNCLDLDDHEYEEYWIVCFKDKHSDYIHEVNYHNIPSEVWCDGEKIEFGEKNGEEVC